MESSKTLHAKVDLLQGLEVMLTYEQILKFYYMRNKICYVTYELPQIVVPQEKELQRMGSLILLATQPEI